MPGSTPSHDLWGGHGKCSREYMVNDNVFITDANIHIQLQMLRLDRNDMNLISEEWKIPSTLHGIIVSVMICYLRNKEYVLFRYMASTIRESNETVWYSYLSEGQ